MAALRRRNAIGLAAAGAAFGALPRFAIAQADNRPTIRSRRGAQGQGGDA